MDENGHNAEGMPREFWSEYTQRPFERCVDCDGELFRDEWNAYAIQKSIVAGETVFEMAVCAVCATNLRSEFSTESQRALAAFVQNAPERLRRLADEDADDAPGEGDDDILSFGDSILADAGRREQRAMLYCAACGKPRNACRRYSIGTACLGSGIVIAGPGDENLGSPFVICDACEMALSECVSEKTRDSWQRFVERNFDGPPGLSVDPRRLAPVF